MTQREGLQDLINRIDAGDVERRRKIEASPQGAGFDCFTSVDPKPRPGTDCHGRGYLLLHAGWTAKLEL